MRAEQISQRLIKPTARIFCLGQEFQGFKWFFFISQRKVWGEIRARGHSSFTQAERKAKVNVTSNVLILNNAPPQHGFLKSIQNSPKQIFTTAKIWRVKQKPERLTVAVSWHAGSSDVRRSVNAWEIRRESKVSVLSQDCCFHLSHKSLLFILSQRDITVTSLHQIWVLKKTWRRSAETFTDPRTSTFSFWDLYSQILLDYVPSDFSLLPTCWNIHHHRQRLCQDQLPLLG